MTTKILITLVSLVVIVLWEIRRAPKRRAIREEEKALEADAKQALKSITRMARSRAKSQSIPVPIAPEETTDVVALHPHRRVGDKVMHAHERKKPAPRPSQYQIVAARRGRGGF